jgi:hypothetical protein
MPDAVQMVIANRLRDGFTVFLAPGDVWVEAIADGAIAGTDEEAQALLAGVNWRRSATSSSHPISSR